MVLKLKILNIGDLLKLLVMKWLISHLSNEKTYSYTFKELCDLCKVSKDQEDHFQKTLDEMSYLGLLEYDYGYHYDHHGRTAPQSERRYILPMFVPGSAELFNMEELSDRSNPRLEDHPDVAAFFDVCRIFLLLELHKWFRLEEQELECMLFQ